MLETVFERIEKRDRLRRLVSQLTNELEGVEASRAEEFVAWLDKVLEQSELASSVVGLEALFDSEHVLGQDDDHGFHPNRYGR